MVFFPPNVETCMGTGSSKTTSCSSNVYCGYHSGVDVGNNPALYANMPYPALNGCADPFNGPQAPNGNSFADAEVSVVAHEANEAITDWAGAWIDANGFEVADECAFTYGTPLGSTGVATDSFATGTRYNQVINGHDYYTQDMFSNVAFAAGEGDINTPTSIPGFSPVKVTGCLQQPDGYHPISPVRLFDTRGGAGGVRGGGVGRGGMVSVKVAGVDGVPATATAVALNVTGVNASLPTFVTVWPDGVTRPPTSNLNLSGGNAVPNFDVVKIGADGKVDFFNSAGSVNLLADIAGYQS